MASYKTASLFLACFVAVSYQASLQKGIASVEKAIESEDMALIKAGESSLPAPAKKIAEAVVAFVQGLEKDIKAEEKKIMGKTGNLNDDLVSMFKGDLEALETGKMSFGPAQKTIKDIMAIDAELEKDSMAEGKKLMGSAKKVVATETEDGKGLFKQEEGQAKKIGSGLLKADEALAAGLAKEGGQLLTGNFDTTGLVKDEENFAKSLVGAEKEAMKDAQMDVKAAIKA